MKIAFLNSAKFWGGGEVFQLSLAVSLSKLKPSSDISFIVHKDSHLASKAEDAGYHVSSFNINKQPLLNFKLWHGLIKYFRQTKLDCIFVSSSSDMKLGALIGKICGIKKIVYIRGQEKPIRCNLLNRYFLSRLCSHVIFSSFATKNTSLKYFSNYNRPTNCHVIYHGINLNEYRDSRYKKVNAIPVISNVGRLIPDKNQRDLLAVAKILKSDGLKFKIEIVGEGSLKDSLQEEIHRNNLEDVVSLVGFKEDIPEYLSQVDIFALTSTTEGFGLVIVEAMNQSLPVVAYNQSSIPELVSHNENGLLVNGQSVHEFAQCLKSILLSPALARSLGKNGKLTAESRFDIDLCTKNIMEKIGL